MTAGYVYDTSMVESQGLAKALNFIQEGAC